MDHARDPTTTQLLLMLHAADPDDQQHIIQKHCIPVSNQIKKYLQEIEVIPLGMHREQIICRDQGQLTAVRLSDLT